MPKTAVTGEESLEDREEEEGEGEGEGEAREEDLINLLFHAKFIIVEPRGFMLIICFSKYL